VASEPLLLGVRHHGPGSARAVRRALEQIRPELVLIEGPPEADGLLEHVHALTPPVAILLHDEAEPENAAFWPFAEFSPEWQAIAYAARAGVEVRFCDLPAAHFLALDADPVRRDPIGELARAARPPAQQIDDGAARRIGERRERRVEVHPRTRCVNHHSWPSRSVQP